MKTLFYITLLFAGTVCYSQNSTIIEYSFKEKKFTNYTDLDSLKEGDFIQIKIKDINPNRVMVKDEVLSSKKESQDFQKFFASIIGAAGSSISPLNIVVPKVEESSSQMAVKQANGSSSIVKVIKDGKDAIVNYFFESVSDEEVICSKAVYEEQKEIAIQLNEYLRDEYRLEKELSEKLFDLNLKLNFNENYPLDEFRSDIEKFDISRNSIYDEKVKVKSTFKLSESYHHCKTQITSEESIKVLTENEKNIDKQQDLIQQKLNELLVVFSDSIKFQFHKIYNKNFKVVERETILPTIRLDENLDSLSIKFYDKQTDELLFTQYLSFPIKLYEKKLRFSGQIFLGSLGSQSYSSYFNEEGELIPVKEHQHPFEFGVATGINYIFYDKKSNITAGVAIGASYSDKIRPRLLFNGGLALGDKNQYLVTGGVVFGYNDKLSNIFKDDVIKIYQATPLVVSKFSTGFQIGIGYFL